MTFEEFRRLITRLRDAQKSYFRSRSTPALDLSKRLEREVDAALADATPDLFQSKEGAD